MEVYCDLERSTVNGVTISLDILTTASKPDLVLVDRTASPTRVDLVELTAPWDSVAEVARVRKELRYTTLIKDISEKGFHCRSEPGGSSTPGTRPTSLGSTPWPGRGRLRE